MPSKLQLLLELALQKKGAYGARRVQRAADEIKNLEKTYSQGALEDAFLGDNAKALMTMNPADFERFAKKLQLEDPISREVAQKNINKLSRIRQGFADVPFLEIDRQKSEYLPNISGHEGRHRMRALEKKGEQESLVRLLPRQSLREDFPRYTQEEYIEALRKELGEKGLVTPEGAFRATPENPYGAIELPEIYAKGGKVSQDAMHMAVMNQKVQRKAKGDLVEDLIKEAKSKQEAPVNPFRMPTQKQSQYEKDFRQYLANQQAAREQVATELPSRLVRGAIPGAAGAIAGYAAQIPGIAGDIASLYQELKPESWRDLPDVVQALPTTERIQQYFLPEEKTSPELQAGITGGNIAALGQGIASLPAAAKGIAKGATAGSKALANEVAYRIHQAMTSGKGALAPMLAGVAPRKMIPSGKSVGKTSFEMQHELAQKRAALPVEQGGLGLPPNNTAEQRAKAMGFVGEGYHGSMYDIRKFHTDKASTESHAGRGTYITDSPKDASLNYASIWGPDVKNKVEREMEMLADERNSIQRIGKRFTDENLTPLQQEILLANTTQANNLGVVYPLKYRADMPVHIDKPQAKEINIGPFEKYDPKSDEYTELPSAKNLSEALKEFEYYGGDSSRIINELSDYIGESIPADVIYRVVAKEANRHSLYDPDTGDIISGGVAASDFLKHFGVDEISHTPDFNNIQLNLGTKHTVSMNPENIRSRFAAFDPFRRNAAIAAAMGVAAPDLMAAEPDKKAEGGIEKSSPRKGTLSAIQRKSVEDRPEPSTVIGEATIEEMAKALREPLQMEGRANFLPFMDTPQGRKVALPGVVAGAVNAITAPSRSYQGGWTVDEDGNIKPAFDAPAEAQNVALNLLGSNAVIAPAAPRGSLSMIPAWHGSPHDIPMGRSMLMEKIGTGEGAQAYGHGLYVAEGKNVADTYAKGLAGYVDASGKAIEKNNLNQPQAMALQYLESSNFNKKNAEKLLKKTWQGMPHVYQPAIDSLDYVIANVKPAQKKLYKLELSHPDPAKEKATPLSPNDFLHWDKPLSQQPESVRKIAQEHGVKDMVNIAEDPQNGFLMSPSLGADVYENLVNKLGKEGASLALNKIGIPGIRYLDAGSRGAGEGTYNYVLFDPKLANIVGKEKEGGVIHKAEGGITSDDLIIEENPL